MKIIVNGVEHICQSQQLDKLLIELGYGNAIVATAINQKFVPVTGRSECVLHAGDQVEILAPMQGG